MADQRPYICRKLKQMNETQEPVWITIGDRRCLVAPFDPWSEDWPLWNQGYFLTKNKGGYHIHWVMERQGRAWTSKHPGGRAFYMSLDNILGHIQEIFPPCPWISV